MTTALAIGAVLLAVAAAAQGVRIGVREGDWVPLTIGFGIVAAILAFYLLGVLIAPQMR